MNERTLRVLEFPKVLEKLAAHSSFSAGKELASELRPVTDLNEVQARLDLTAEARFLLENRPETTLGGARDVRPGVRLAALGRGLDPNSFLEIQVTLESSRTLRRSILKLNQDGSVFYLSQIATRLADLPLLEGEIQQTIGPDGTVLDSASPALRRIREQIRTAHGRLLDRLNSIITSSQYQAALQEAIITMRDGRYVIPVKSDFKGQVRGIIHDQSASGATVYVEPLAVVELNNQWRQFQLDERDEIERIMRELSGKVAVHAADIIEAVEALAELDLAFAKARYAAELRATQPKLSLPVTQPNSTGSQLNFIQARHPLLTGKVVPIDIYFGQNFRILVITGPNTGGKTVSIKTAGLLTLMVQAGLHIPVEDNSEALVFQKIYADIGDEQSIQQSLSTFSSHMTNIIDMLGEIGPETLVILDELGAGTDPAEGAALARSIIQFTLNQQAYAFITTHYSELKTFAYLTSGVQNASVHFDVQTLSPTYRLDIGLPGRSNALAIASRLGLRQDIIEEARSQISEEDTQVDALLSQIHREREEAANIRYDTMKIKAESEKLREELNQQLRNIEEEKRKAVASAREDARQQLENELSKVRDESRALRQRLLDIEQAARDVAQSAEMVAQLEKQRKALAVAEKAAEELQREARRRIQSRRIQEREEESPELSLGELKPGDRVRIESLQQEGQLLNGPDSEGKYDVQFGSFKVKVVSTDLRKLPGKPRSNDDTPRTARERSDAANQREKSIRVNARSRSEVASDTSLELDMRGWRAEEVASALDRYLNDAYLANLPFVRLVHGKGTGVLRQVVREYLKSHSLVKSSRLGEAGEGGDGVTIVTLVS